MCFRQQQFLEMQAATTTVSYCFHLLKFGYQKSGHVTTASQQV
jgi:hypothetical protein